MTEYKVGQEVTIPKSELGAKYGIGKIVAVWGGKMAVDFKGHLGHYTIEKNEIYNVVTFSGIKLALDSNIPENEIHVRY